MTMRRGRFRKSLGFCLLTAVCLAGPVWASGPATAGSMVTGQPTSQPIGHYEFCRTRPAECAIRPAVTRPAHLTASLWKLLQRVNARVNRTVKPVNDIDVYGREEVWTYPNGGVGDCEDYVLEKRRLLRRKGMSFANLLITVVRKPNGEGHAVLTVRTDRGDFVLDNLSRAIRPWNRTGYRYLKRQASSNTGRWVSLREENNTLVGAVNN